MAGRGRASAMAGMGGNGGLDVFKKSFSFAMEGGVLYPINVHGIIFMKRRTAIFFFCNEKERKKPFFLSRFFLSLISENESKLFAGLLATKLAGFSVGFLSITSVFLSLVRRASSLLFAIFAKSQAAPRA